MRVLNLIWPHSIRRQMMAIILCAVMFASFAGDFTANALKNMHMGPMGVEDYTFAMSSVARMVESLPPQARAENLERWREIGIDVTLISAKEAIEMARAPTLWARLSAWLRQVPETLSPGFGIVQTHDATVLTFPISDQQVLVFAPPVHYLLDGGTIHYLAAVSALMLGFSVLAVRGIAGPVRHMAGVMKATDSFLASDQPIPENGPREIRELARGMNDLRGRIRALLEARTAMLRNVSHDLRTPLTRLRLRLDRIEDPSLRNSALQDLRQIDDMIDTTLEYLRVGPAPSCFERSDIASLLQTICADFADTGAIIHYTGPRHLVAECSVNDLTRAINNFCENGLKFGTSVRVTAALQGAEVLIDIADDGPGIPVDLREDMLQPFVKMDLARGSAGFGLGLSIAAEIIARHNGVLELLQNEPKGLLVRVRLPQTQSPARMA